MISSSYQVGGSLDQDNPTYVHRRADEQLYTALKAGDFCYVFNARQMGKSSLMVRAKSRLESDGYGCTIVDMTRIGSQQITPLQWYKGIVGDLWRGFNCLGKINLKTWWKEREDVSLLQKLSDFIQELLFEQFPEQHLCIFIDEIDSILDLDFPIDDFFALIRYCYNQRAINPEYKRITFALFGVATPSDLILDKTRTPFNIGQGIDLCGFTVEEALPLAKELQGRITQAQLILKEIIAWTGGQPFLTQKLCQLVDFTLQNAISQDLIPPLGSEAFWIESLVRSHIIEHWETQDEPEHLKTIRDRLFRNEQRAGRLLGIYQQILQNIPVITNDSPEQTELLLSGLLIKKQGYLQIKNRIYQEVFNQSWVEKQLEELRPYSQVLEAWISTGKADESRLLRGQALKDAQTWAMGKSLSDLDYQFLASSVEADRREVQLILEAQRTQEVEARLTQEKQAAKRQKNLLIAVSFALLVACGLGITSYIQYRRSLLSEYQARLSEIQALVSSSDGLFISNRHLDALIEAIKAKNRLKNLQETDINIQDKVENVLRQAVYETDEYNRLLGHKAAVMAVDISPDSSLIASGSVDKTIKLWGRDGQEVATLRGHQGTVRTLNFSTDSQFIASGGDDGTVKLWKRDGTLLNTFGGNGVGVWGVAFSPDGQNIVSSSMDGAVKIWRRDGILLKTLQQQGEGVWGVAFSPDGQWIAAGSFDKTIKLWKSDGTGARTFRGHPGLVVSVAFSPDSQTLASASGDKTVKLWKLDGTLLRTLEGHSAAVYGVAWSPDGQTLASGSVDKTIKLWGRDGTPLHTLKGHLGVIWGLDWSADGQFIASAGAENSVRLWQSQNPFRTVINPYQGGVWGVDISQDGQTIVTGTVDGWVKLWNRQGQLLKTLQSEHRGSVAVDLSQDQNWIVAASNHNTVTLWKRDGTLVKTLIGHTALVWAVALSPNAQIIASGGEDNTIKVWNREGTLRKTLTGHQATVWQVVFSPDGRWLASASADGTVKLWAADGTLLRTFKGHETAVWRVAWSPDGEMLASGSADNTIKLWKRDGTLLRTLEGHTAAVWGVAFSPRGDRLASGSVDNTVKLWTVEGKELTTLRGHSAALRGLAYSPDGKFVASVGEDNNLILWNIENVLNLDLLSYGSNFVRDYLTQSQPEVRRIK
ncbi:WD40 domain-containing protein [Planktothrix paucivesiculata]|uniref:WD-40 repeat protein n=1 Tax=Planktothrix paucivesiculata PCC 9631 TaxID=671071 RepID=A0A7Z9BJ85_9CYAN|nr:AAA-like domain-containing protein [Planktothrix paucivesiculata]VXD13179.1 WD-40 repeat protein [Planktothrix paucivesiculata PCC 9631]